jgi:hypothetical protein
MHEQGSSACVVCGASNKNSRADYLWPMPASLGHICMHGSISVHRLLNVLCWTTCPLVELQCAVAV